MAFSCVQSLRCRHHLCSKTVTLTMQYLTRFHHYATRRGTLALSAALFNSDNHTPYPPRERGKQQKCYYSIVKHVESEVKENKYSKEFPRMDFVSVKSPLAEITDGMPVTENHMSPNLDVIPELSALEEIGDNEAVSISVPSAVPPASTSLREYVDQSETLTKLVQLGVNLWKLEQRPNVGSMLLKLDFKTDVVPRLLFLKDIGVEDSRFGYIITRNPFFLTESLENLETRVKYLKSKKFSSETVASMVSRAPYLLNFSVKRLDNRLGFYQQQLSLSDSNTRNIVTRLPRLLCSSLEPVKENLKVCEIEFGLKRNEIQHIIITVPKVLTANKKKLTQIFDFLHNTMNIPHRLIVKFPQVFNSKYLRIRERHLFLQYLGKAQYDPAQSNYIPLDRLVSLPDEAFCTEVALATLEDFYLFQKTL